MLVVLCKNLGTPTDQKNGDCSLICRNSLKAVLLHNKNMLPSIPVGYAAHMKETYEKMKNVLQCINYEQYCWQLCGDFKVIAILLGLQPGYTKYCCFLCEWDSRARHEHCLKKEWPKRSTLKAGTKKCKLPLHSLKHQKFYFPLCILHLD